MSLQRLWKHHIPAAALATTLAVSGVAVFTSDTMAGAHPPAQAPATVPAHVHDASTASQKPLTQTELYTTMRTLWARHMAWTYAAVVAFAGDSPTLQPTIDRLLRNQADIGNAIAPFYGDAAAQQLTDLLSTHIQDAVPVLTAAKAGDTTAQNAAVDKWYANAQDIADFLASANPQWADKDMREMMKTHITQTIAYATAALTGDYAGAITKYDEADAHMAQMADLLSQGIVRQFPKRFH